MNAVMSPLPQAWPKIQLRFLANCQLGKTIAADAVAPKGVYPVFRAGGVRGYSAQSSHSGPCLLIATRGSHCGDVYFASGPFWASEQVIVVQAKSDVCDIRWLEIALRAMNLKAYATGASGPSLPVSSLLDLAIAVPPIIQQQQIAQYVTGEMQRMDAAIGEMENVIALTKDRRIALTQAAAAGQLQLQEMPS